VYPFLLFFGRLTVAKQPTGGYTTYLPKHNFCLYLDNVRCNDAWSGGRGIWIYNERKGINLKVYSQNYMDITLEQEKLLTEIISRIPEKTKIFTII
jgi:hypothetical protein